MNVLDLADPIALRELATRFRHSACDEKANKRLPEASNSFAIASALEGRAERLEKRA